MEKWKIIALKDTNSDGFRKLIEENCLEAKEIAEEYFNPLIVSNIILCKLKYLKEKETDKVKRECVNV